MSGCRRRQVASRPDRSLCAPVLQCVAEYCSVLQCVAACCSVVQCVAATTHQWLSPAASRFSVL